MHKPDFGRFSSAFGLIRARPQAAAESFLNWQRDVLADYGLSFSEPAPLHGALENALVGLLPLTMPGMLRVMFWPVADDWTIYFDNSGLGTEAPTVMPVLSERLGVDAVRVCMSDDVRDPSTKQILSYPATIFEYYTKGASRRVVYAANDGGKWKFGANGIPFPFEDFVRYDERAVRNRFTQEMLLTYLSALDISLGNASSATQQSPGYGMRKLGRLPFTPREC